MTTGSRFYGHSNASIAVEVQWNIRPAWISFLGNEGGQLAACQSWLRLTNFEFDARS